MKRTALALTAVAMALAGTAAGQALARPTHTWTPTLRVVMHDPGCHWFLVGGKYLKSTSVAGPIKVVNLDEATLKVASATGTRRIPVGKSIVLLRGSYGITMVGQASDDNHLKLSVR